MKTGAASPLWLGTVRQWHWISAAICLAGLLLFAITGITLNHAGQIEASPTTHTKELTLPTVQFEALIRQVQIADQLSAQSLPDIVEHWLAEQGIYVTGRKIEWSEDEVYIPMPRPGGDAWLAIDLISGQLLFEDTDRGLVSYLNDLHKGRNTGNAWRWFIDAFSLACIVFGVTGLWLLIRHRLSRPTTWPLVGLGVVLPLLLMILFVHR
ncbi:MAG: PepSY-associated TM helix domain-containing protein [Parahaliea sp.]